MSAFYVPRSLSRLIVGFVVTTAVISLLAWATSHTHAQHSNTAPGSAFSAPNTTLDRAPSSPNSFVVDSTLDEPNPDPTTGVCNSTPSQKCTLRAAVMVANYVSGPSTITVPPGVYMLTRAGYDDGALVGDLDIKKNVTIQGAGSGATIIDGNGAVTQDRVFEILSTVQNATLKGLTIRQGLSISSTVGVIGGGGLYMEGAGQLALSDVLLDSNTAQNGGGLYANFSSQGGSLTMNNVVVHANTAIAGGVGAGGGVFAYLPSTLSHLDLQASQVYGNTADGTGGGLFVEGNTSIQWSIQRSEIYLNTAASGGGIGNLIPLALSDSHLHNNRAALDGGAIEAFSPLVILRTTLDANSAGRFGGGIFDLQNGASSQEFAHIEASTLSGNGALYGGGIYHDGFITPNSLLMLLNSTLSGNTAFRPSGTNGSSDGGGIYIYGGQAELLNATIAGNTADPSFGIHSHLARGGGVFITATAQITFANSMIANNLESNGISVGTPDDCFSYGTLGTLAYDLFTTTANCSVTGPQGGNVVTQNPLLGPLQDNGGSTQTIALLAGSPAIDAGALAGCTDDLGAGLTHDQRSAARPVNARCDIGAFEYGSIPPTLTPTPTPTPTPTFAAPNSPTPTLTPTPTSPASNSPTPTLTPTPSPVSCASKPPAPSLLKPGNGKQVTKERVLLDWSDVQCAAKYKVLVRKGSAKGSKVDGKKVTVSQYKTIALPAGVKYYWEVKACDAAGCTKSIWSEFARK